MRPVVILGVLASFFCTAAEGKAYRFGGMSKSHVEMIDVASLKRQGARVQGWTLFVVIDLSNDSPPPHHSLLKYEWDCIEEKYRVLAYAAYSNRGDETESRDAPLDWEIAFPDTGADETLQRVCAPTAEQIGDQIEQDDPMALADTMREVMRKFATGNSEQGTGRNTAD